MRRAGEDRYTSSPCVWAYGLQKFGSNQSQHKVRLKATKPKYRAPELRCVGAAKHYVDKYVEQEDNKRGLNRSISYALSLNAMVNRQKKNAVGKRASAQNKRHGSHERP